LAELTETLTYPGFWRLALKHTDEGAREMVCSFYKPAFVRRVQRLVPEIQAEDLVPYPAGVRAQAIAPNGELVDDFSIVQSANAIHVCNAPSPAATASLEIGRHVASMVGSAS
jgi:L-2-hydroxyglutarate oxidase